jgi:hypothetical protein
MSTLTGFDPIQSWLKAEGVAYELRDLLDRDIDVARSTANQARIETPVNPELIERYANAAEKGAKFPPLVAYQKGRSFVLIDGNNRFAAFRKVYKPGFTVAVYIVTASPEVLARLTYTANVILNGAEASMIDRTNHAVRLLRAGMTQAEVSVATGLPKGTVQTAIASADALERASRLAVTRNVAGLPPSSRSVIAYLPSDVGFVATARAASDLNLTSDEVRQLAGKVRKARGDDEAKAVVARYVDETRAEQDTRRKSRSAAASVSAKQRPVWMPFQMHAAAILNMDPTLIYKSCLSDETRQTVEETAVKLLTWLEDLD